MKKSLWKKILKLKPHLRPEVFALLSKYRARSLYALGLKNTTNEELGRESTEAYFVFLKLALAYSALELLNQATGKSRGVKIRSVPLSYALAKGKFLALTNQIREATPPRSKAKVEKYLELVCSWSGSMEQPDLYEFVGLCRHLMFHGAFSPSGSRLTNSRVRQDLLLGLAHDSLLAGDRFLERWADARWQEVSRVRHASDKRGF